MLAELDRIRTEILEATEVDLQVDRVRVRTGIGAAARQY
jgi:hypothetical protein